MLPLPFPLPSSMRFDQAVRRPKSIQPSCRYWPSSTALLLPCTSAGRSLRTADLRNLESLSWIFTGLLTSLILGSFGLIALTRWNYGMLVATHQ